MSTSPFRRFSKPAFLREIEPKCFVEFLQPFRAWLQENDVSLPNEPSAETIPYDRVAQVLAEPETGIPHDLVEAMYCVSELAGPVGLELLSAAASERGVKLPPDEDLSPADVAVRMWVDDPGLVKRKHMECRAQSRRSFSTYTPRSLT